MHETPPKVLPDPPLQPNRLGEPPGVDLPEPHRKPWNDPEPPEPPTPQPPELPPEPSDPTHSGFGSPPRALMGTNPEIPTGVPTARAFPTIRPA
jgi:hypothetical protein